VCRLSTVDEFSEVSAELSFVRSVDPPIISQSQPAVPANSPHTSSSGATRRTIDRVETIPALLSSPATATLSASPELRQAKA
jgi:hypothetical protein